MAARMQQGLEDLALIAEDARPSGAGTVRPEAGQHVPGHSGMCVAAIADAALEKSRVLIREMERLIPLEQSTESELFEGLALNLASMSDAAGDTPEAGMGLDRIDETWRTLCEVEGMLAQFDTSGEPSSPKSAGSSPRNTEGPRKHRSGFELKEKLGEHIAALERLAKQAGPRGIFLPDTGGQSVTTATDDGDDAASVCSFDVCNQEPVSRTTSEGSSYRFGALSSLGAWSSEATGSEDGLLCDSKKVRRMPSASVASTSSAGCSVMSSLPDCSSGTTSVSLVAGNLDASIRSHFSMTPAAPSPATTGEQTPVWPQAHKTVLTPTHRATGTFQAGGSRTPRLQVATPRTSPSPRQAKEPALRSLAWQAPRPQPPPLGPQASGAATPTKDVIGKPGAAAVLGETLARVHAPATNHSLRRSLSPQERRMPEPAPRSLTWQAPRPQPRSPSLGPQASGTATPTHSGGTLTRQDVVVTSVHSFYSWTP